MLLWMRSFGELVRVGVECTGSYGAGLLRYLQQAQVTVLEVTAPDKSPGGWSNSPMYGHVKIPQLATAG
jgi:hypothetical protein